MMGCLNQSWPPSSQCPTCFPGELFSTHCSVAAAAAKISVALAAFLATLTEHLLATREGGITSAHKSKSFLVAGVSDGNSLHHDQGQKRVRVEPCAS